MTLTTYEMDGLFTEEDIKNRNTVVFQCIDCKDWTTHYNWVMFENTEHVPCQGCGAKHYDSTSIKSLRTYNPLTDKKRKIKIKPSVRR